MGTRPVRDRPDADAAAFISWAAAYSWTATRVFRPHNRDRQIA